MPYVRRGASHRPFTLSDYMHAIRGPARGMGQTLTPATCPAPKDPTWPNGCPSGFSLQEVYYVPNSAQTNVTASTPGAIPLPNPSVSAPNCFAYACQNPSGQNPTHAQTGLLLTPAEIALGAAALASLVLLPGAWKLAAIPLGVLFFLQEFAGGD